MLKSNRCFVQCVPTKLYSLKPRGIGTRYYVESLTSHINRLADAHHLKVGTLLYGIILKSEKALNLKSDYRTLGNINGFSKAGQDLIAILEEFTGLKNMKLLTTWNTKDLILVPLKGHKAWCPKCYTEWHDRNEIIYEPLLWYLLMVDYCPKHKISLVSECPHCGKKNPKISGRSRLGFCLYCSKWLGQENNITGVKDEDWSKWVVSNISEFLKYEGKMSLNNLSQNLIMLKNKLKSMDYISRQSGVGVNTLNYWKNGEEIPNGETLLKLCYSINIPIKRMYSKILSENDITSAQTKLERKIKKGNRIKAKDNVQLKQRLQELLNMAKDNVEIPPIGKVAEMFHLSRQTIKTAFPNETKELQEVRDTQQSILLEKRREQRYLQIKRIVFDLYEKGIYPSKEKVGILINKNFYSNSFENKV
ncbi:TniQ family protein [Desulfosporosinus sp. FKB]|uniref:TniQ family protein n=1 Tax=Desulfosporosinus sp. FKB TaxID=1969835 RepID=UPI001483A246|nr:TniQ family protein [Desulfosporosinus sp. FKB]